MINMDALFQQVSGLDSYDLQRWIENTWVRPRGAAGHYEFRDIDVARVRLICVLRDDMQVNEDAMPVVLLLLDQLHDVRRQMREIGEALTTLAPEQVRSEILERISGRDFIPKSNS
jgi:chaperone modulatory protein CbpM